MGLVVICAATATEANACRAGVAAHPDFEVLSVGVGPENAMRSLSQRLERGPWPAIIVSSGFAGAITRDIPRTSWVSAERLFLEASDGAVTEVERPLLPGIPDVRSVALLSSPKLFRQSMLQRKGVPASVSPESVSIDAIDMESAALAVVAARFGIKFAVLRLITDAPGAELPVFVGELAEAMATREFKQRLIKSVSALIGGMREPIRSLEFARQGLAWRGLLKVGWKRYAEFFGVP